VGSADFADGAKPRSLPRENVFSRESGSGFSRGGKAREVQEFDIAGDDSSRESGSGFSRGGKAREVQEFEMAGGAR